MKRRLAIDVSSESGAVAVEFALLVPLLLLFVLGIVDFGRAWYFQIRLTQAAREGVRIVALDITSPTPTARTLQAACGDSSDPSYASCAAQTTVTVVTTCSSTPGPTDTGELTATMSYSFVPWFGNAISRATAFSIQGKGVMRCGG